MYESMSHIRDGVCTPPHSGCEAFSNFKEFDRSEIVEVGLEDREVSPSTP
jgi:hypothetical protein